MTAPIKFAHVVLRSADMAGMVEWWSAALDATPRFANDFITFLSYDDEHHRVAIANVAHLDRPVEGTVGVDHVAFTFANLDALLDKFEQLRTRGVEPFWSVHHGMTLSLYYRDPDGNKVEFQIDTCSLPEAKTFMASPVFAANPIGIEVDIDDIMARRRSGTPDSELTAYPG